MFADTEYDAGATGNAPSALASVQAIEALPRELQKASQNSAVLDAARELEVSAQALRGRLLKLLAHLKEEPV